MELLKHLGVFGSRKTSKILARSQVGDFWYFTGQEGGRRNDLVGKPMDKMVVDVDLHLEMQTIF